MANETSKLFSSKPALFIIFILVLYGLSWALYGLQFSHDSQIVLQHYGGIDTYQCTGTAATGKATGRGYIKMHPTSYVLPFDGISYTIKYGSGPNIASGKVSLFGDLKQTNIQYSNDPLCALL